jgi:hypothetical protein
MRGNGARNRCGIHRRRSRVDSVDRAAAAGLLIRAAARGACGIDRRQSSGNAGD